MQITAEHVVVVVVVRRVVVVVGRRVVVVVVVVVVSDVGALAVVLVVVDVVVVDVVVVEPADEEADDPGPVLVVTVAPADCEAGGIGSTAPNSDGSRSGRSPLSIPKANNVQAIAPTTAPAASRPCPLCRVDSMWVSFGVGPDDH